MPASALRLQIVRALAQMTQSTPAEIEALFELSKPVARARVAPPRSGRPSPVGLERQILRLLVAHPGLGAGLDQDALDVLARLAPERAEVLLQLVTASRTMGEHASFAALAEQLRASGNEFDDLIAEIAADQESDSDAARLELAGALRQTKMKLVKSEMEGLAAAGLQTEEGRQRYRELMLLQEQLRRQAEAEIAQR